MNRDQDITWVTDLLPDVPAPEPEVTERAYLALMEHLGDATPVPSPRRRLRARRPRRALQLGLVAAGAAAVAAVAVNVGTTGHGSVPTASAAQIIARSQTALAPGPGQVLSYTIVDAQGNSTQTAEDGATPEDWALRPTSADGTPGIADGEEGGVREFYEPATNTIYRDSDTSMVIGISPSDVALVDEMKAPGAQTTVDQNATLDGQPATEVTSTESDGTQYALWVEPGTDRPLQFIWTPPSGATQTTTWRDYQTVTPSASTPSPALLSAVYPSATVTTLDNAAWQAARSSAGGAAGGS